MTAYYVATLARYVVVEAEDEADAKERGVAAFRQLWPDKWWAPEAIRTVRPAKTDGIERHRPQVDEPLVLPSVIEIST